MCTPRNAHASYSSMGLILYILCCFSWAVMCVRDVHDGWCACCVDAISVLSPHACVKARAEFLAPIQLQAAISPFSRKSTAIVCYKTGSYCIEFSLTAVYLSAAWFSKLIPVLLPVPCRQKSFYRLTMSTMCIYISCGKNWLWFVLKAQSSSCTFTCLRSATWIPNGDVRRLPCCSSTTTS